MAKISELSDGGSLQSTDFLIAVRSGGNVKVQANGNLSLGTVTADGLTVDGSAAFNLGVGEEVSIYRSTDFAVLRLGASSTDHWSFQEAGTNSLFIGSTDSGTSVNHLKLDNNGDISFYEDTGTTPKFFWDASAESLGIGSTTPNTPLQVSGANSSTNADALFSVQKTTEGYGLFSGVLATGVSWLQGGTSDDLTYYNLALQPNGGNVGIGTSSPVSFGANTAGLTVNGSLGSHITWQNNGTNVAFAYTAGNNFLIGSEQASSDTIFIAAGLERMRIDANGNVGIANSSLSNWSSGYNALQVGGRAFFAAYSTSDSYFGQNAYINTGWKYASTAAASFIQQSGGKIQFYVAPSGTADSAITWTNAATMDNNGNLLVGTTDTTIYNNTSGGGINLMAANRLDVAREGDVVATFNRMTDSGQIVQFYQAGGQVGSIGADNASINIGTGNTGLLFYNTATAIYPRTAAGAQSNGAIDLGGASDRFKDLYLSGGMNLARDVSSETEIETYNNTNAGGAKYKISFRQNSTQVGVIEVGTSSTSYLTSSDYRLKENVVAISGATERLKQLKPSRFNFIAEPDTIVDGFLAHEVQDIVPEAISGTKDAVDAEGNPVHQGIDQSKLVPLLVATIQELEARIAALEGAN